MICTLVFWKGAGERAIKTFFQVFVAMITLSVGTNFIPSVGIEGVPWLAVLSASLLSSILSVGTSIGNASFTAGAQETPAVATLSSVVPVVSESLPVSSESLPVSSEYDSYYSSLPERAVLEEEPSETAETTSQVDPKES